MYNYSPKKNHRGEKNQNPSAQMHIIGSLDNLPAVPDRHSSASLCDNITDTTQTVFNLYESVDNLSLNFDKECDDSGDRDQHQHNHQEAAQGSADEFQTQLDQIEQAMKSLSRPRFQLP